MVIPSMLDIGGRYGNLYLSIELGPPPTRLPALAWGGQLLWLTVGMGYWVDANREIREVV